MKYSIEYMKTNAPKTDIIFVFDKPYELLGQFLFAEYNVLDQILTSIGEIQSGTKEQEEWNMNVFFLRIRIDVSYIEDMYPDEDENPLHCSVNTCELKNVILEYQRACAKFSKEIHQNGLSQGVI